jgi:hypothetical protein
MRELLDAWLRKVAAPAKSARVFPVCRGTPVEEPLPPVIAELRAVTEAWGAERRRVPADDDYIDFQVCAERDAGFISAWTNNADHEAEFYVFGKDGTGSGVAFWLVHDAPLAEQPVVFMGSEGDDVRAVAKDLPNFLSLIAAGLEPREAPWGEKPQPMPGVRVILDRYFPSHVSRSPEEICAEELVGTPAPSWPRFAAQGFRARSTECPCLLPSAHATVRRALDQWFEGVKVRPALVAEFDDSVRRRKKGRASLRHRPYLKKSSVAGTTCRWWGG